MLVASPFQNALAVYALAGALFVTAVIFSTVADIDSHSSIPGRWFNRLIIGGVVLVAMVVMGLRANFSPDSLIPVVTLPPEAVPVGAGALIVTSLVVPYVVQGAMPQHRGPLHNIWYWAIALLGASVVLYAGILEVPGPEVLQQAAALIPIAALFGVAVHLAMDGELA